MDGLAKWLADISWPIVSRVLTSLGVGYVTYEGATTAVGSALSASKAAFAGLGADLLQLFALAGVFDALSITSGGIVSGLAWMVMKHFALQTTGPEK